MAQSRKHITPENVTEWLASTGFLFPRNEVELARFEKLFGEEDLGLRGDEIDPDNIIKGSTRHDKPIVKPQIDSKEIEEYRMVARNGSSLPKHIMDKIKKNQNNANINDTPTQEDSDK